MRRPEYPITPTDTDMDTAAADMEAAMVNTGDTGRSGDAGSRIPHKAETENLLRNYNADNFNEHYIQYHHDDRKIIVMILSCLF